MNNDSDYKDELEQLNDVSKRLNQQTIELNAKFDSIERRLCEMNIGVSGWASTLIGVKDDSNEAYAFGFCRIGKGWKFVCKKVNKNDQKSLAEKTNYGLLEPITAMSRSIRLEASNLIGDVISDLLRRSSVFVDDVSGAVDVLSKTEQTMKNNK